MRLYSKLAEYAIRSLVILATGRIWRMRVKTICEGEGLPVHFTRKATQLLVRHKILEATRGPHGGYVLKMEPEKIKILDIVKIFDNVETEDKCPAGPVHCSTSKPCPLRKTYLRMQAKSYESLGRITLADLVPKNN